MCSIVAAVQEGRRVWDNIRKILIFNLPVNLAQGLSIMYSYILGLKYPPITALQVRRGAYPCVFKTCFH